MAHAARVVYGLRAVSTWVRQLGPTRVLLTRLSLDAPLAQTRDWGSAWLDADGQTVSRALVARWERFNTARCWLAAAAVAQVLAAAAPG